MKKIVILNSAKRNCAVIDRNKYFEDYSVFDKNGCFKQMACGAPIIINIRGTYYDLAKLASIAIFGANYIDDFIRECRNPDDCYNSKIVFIWR